MSEEIENGIRNLIAKLDNGSHSSSQLQAIDEALTDLFSQALQKRDSELLEWIKNREEKCRHLKGSQYINETPEYFDGKLAILGDLTNKIKTLTTK